MVKNLTFWRNSLEKLWPSDVDTSGTLLEPNGLTFSFCQYFSGNILTKWWPSGVATLGTLLEIK
jgi:hypothetical protein